MSDDIIVYETATTPPIIVYEGAGTVPAVYPAGDGPRGLSAYEVAVADGFVGTVDDWLDSLVGPPGTGSQSNYNHNQPTASATWTISHNLGYKPIVQIYDSGSQLVEADVSHLSVNTVVILFSTPTAGFARLI